MKPARDPRSPHTPKRLLAAICLAALAAAACGDYHDDYYDDYYDDGYYGGGHHGGPPHYEVEITSRDAIDGYVDPWGHVEIASGLQASEDGSVAFVAFDLTPIPYDAYIVSAELVLVNTFYAHFAGGIELALSAVHYGPTLDPLDVTEPRSGSEDVLLGPGAAGAAIVVDVTALVAEEHGLGGFELGLRLDAFGGDLEFEDAGSNLGTGGVPLLIVVYE